MQTTAACCPGSFYDPRVQVGPSQWKTTLINIQLSARLVFFKTITKQEYETRSDFRAVSGDLSLLEGSRLLAP